MRHRHLTDDAGFCSPAVDDIISRGLLQDWIGLRDAVMENPQLLDVIEKVCLAFADDPSAQRHRFWLNHVNFRRGTA